MRRRDKSLQMEGKMQMQQAKDMKVPRTLVRSAPETVADGGKVRLGMASPSLPPVRIVPATVADRGKVRLGMASPLI